MIAISARAADPQFFVESIRVDGIRYASAHVVVAESRLVTGRSYSEAQLRDAVARVHRLPFVIHTDVRLEKGSERGRYVLVITIEETKPLFVDYQSSFEQLPLFHSNGSTTTLHLHNDFTTVGGRLFIGSRGMLSGSAALNGNNRFAASDPVYALGYTQYDLFGTRASVALLTQYRESSFNVIGFDQIFAGRRTMSFGDHLTWDLSFAIPLRGNNAIRGSWHRETFITDVNPQGKDEIVRKLFDHPQLSWVYDTTDDLLFPTRGSYAEAGFDGLKRVRLVFEPGSRQNVDAHYYWDNGFAGHLRRYKPLTSHQSIFGGVDTYTRQSAHGYEVDPHVGYAVTLLSRPLLGYSELRFEAETGRSIYRYTTNASFGYARAGLAIRNSWGVARIDFRYTGWEHTN
jgi:outer membrane protein assembly factor BamA